MHFRPISSLLYNSCLFFEFQKYVQNWPRGNREEKDDWGTENLTTKSWSRFRPRKISIFSWLKILPRKTSSQLKSAGNWNQSLVNAQIFSRLCKELVWPWGKFCKVRLGKTFPDLRCSLLIWMEQYTNLWICPFSGKWQLIWHLLICLVSRMKIPGTVCS